MCQGRSCFSRKQFSSIIQSQCYLKNMVQSESTSTCPCCSCFFHLLTFQKTLGRFFCSYTLQRKRKKKKGKEPALREFCLVRFSSKSYSPFDLLLIYRKTIACYARIVSSCRTKPLQHKAEMLLFTRIRTVRTTLWTLNCFHFGECTGFS